MLLTNIFLRARHWQLFIPTFGILLVVYVVSMLSVFITAAIGSEPEPEMFFVVAFPVCMLLYVVTFLGWIWSVATGLQHRIPDIASMMTGTFKVLFIIPLLYILIMSIVLGAAWTNAMSEYGDETHGDGIGPMAIIIPMHLFSMGGILYCMYFAAKTMKTVELQRDTTFSDFVGEFFLIWFFPVGIWVLQPKINRMAEGKSLLSNPFEE